MKEGYRQMIQIGSNVTSIMKLQCVSSCRKKLDGSLYYVLDIWGDDGNRLEARQGDWLCQDYDGVWSLRKDNDIKDEKADN